VRIPLTDVGYQHRLLRAELEDAIWGLLNDQTCDGSRELRALEQDLGERLGGVMAVGVQSGTAGLFLALKALGIGPGDEVITVPNSDLPTTAAISHTGARFILVDVEPDTFNIDPVRLEACITPRTRAILPVHLYGHPAEMDPIMAVAQRHGLSVVEDATLALGATYNGRLCGTIGDLAVFSFAPRKVIGAAGNGGVVVTADPELDRRVRLFRGYGLDPAHADAPIGERLKQAGLAHQVEGYNLKLDGLQAAIVQVKLTRLDEWLAERRRVAGRYDERFRGSTVLTPVVRPGCKHAFRNYVIQVRYRDEVRRSLHARGIASAVLYAPPVHLQPVYHDLGLGPGSFPVAEALAERLLCLPIYPGMPDEYVDEVAEAVLAACAGAAMTCEAGQNPSMMPTPTHVLGGIRGT
jgi:dTDP-4-amino-4,6-dideoxygalactose transaminase